MNKTIMETFGFKEEVKRVEAGKCPFCGLPVFMEEFRNELSKKEFKISGLCQSCQDNFFGKD